MLTGDAFSFLESLGALWTVKRLSCYSVKSETSFKCCWSSNRQGFLNCSLLSPRPLARPNPGLHVVMGLKKGPRPIERDKSARSGIPRETGYFPSSATGSTVNPSLKDTVAVKSRPSGSLSYLVGRRLTGVAPGLVSLTVSLQLVHMNSQAVHLLKQFEGAEHATFPGPLPMVVRSVAERLLASLNDCHSVEEWGELYVSEYFAAPALSLYLQAYVLPDPAQLEHSRIILIIEEKTVGKAASVVPSKNRFQLTEREIEVLMHLAKGLTNKEIGVRLGISEQTVKEHLKHIMEKTHCTTRTGVLMQLLHEA
jgi:DNA-binding CsgD family transcriptional regulator